MDLKHIIRKSNSVALIFYLLICSFIINLLINGLFTIFNLNGIEQDKSIQDIDLFKIAAIIIVAPLLETFFFQSLPYYFLSMFSFFKERKILIVFISAMIFGLCHHKSLINVIVTFLCGAMLSTVFILREKNKGFLIVYVTHTIWNTFVTLIELTKKYL
jgi:membrane protease YdiL (CAAX protease family)